MSNHVFVVGSAASVKRGILTSCLLAMTMIPGPAMAQQPSTPVRVETPAAPLATETPAPAQAGPSQAGPASGVAQPSTQPGPAMEQAPPADAPPGAVDRAHLPTDLSPWGMFMAADIIVKMVMIGLVVASFAVWAVWLSKLMELMTARLGLRRGLSVLVTEATLDGAVARMTKRTAAARVMTLAAQNEIEMSHDVLVGGSVKERIASRLAEIEAALTRRMRRGMSLLATVGATAPFIGLFGTVWGIMNSFIGISRSQTTNLAVVAPGIAEALLATAFGLVAAIPAVILYNHLSRSIAEYRALVRESGGEVERLVSRDLDRRSTSRSPAATLVRRG